MRANVPTSAVDRQKQDTIGKSENTIFLLIRVYEEKPTFVE